MTRYIDEVKNSINTSNINQAKTLLKDLPEQSRNIKLEVLHALALAPDKTALALIDFLFFENSFDPEFTDRLVQLTTDRAHLNFQFVLILFRVLGDGKIKRLSRLIRHILSNETRIDLLTVIIETIGRERIENMVDDVAEFIFYDDETLKAKAVKALERIGTPPALNRLVQAAETEKCDQNILDTIAVLKGKNPGESPGNEADDKDVSPAGRLVEKLGANDLDTRYRAWSELKELGRTALPFLMPGLSSGDHDRVITTLGIFSRTLPVTITSRVFSLLEAKSPVFGIRFAAYDLLGDFAELESAAGLVKGLSDNTSAVRIAAARALDKNLTDYVSAEIRKKIESGTRVAPLLAQAIVDAGATCIMEELLSSDTFSYIVSNYLLTDAPRQVLETYVSILEKRRLSATARKYKALLSERSGKKLPRVLVVSRSETVLKVYARLITSAGGDPAGFLSTQDAFESCLAQKPGLIITDLFLNDMTGPGFASEVRDLYSKDDLAIVVSSLQKNLVQVLSDQKAAADIVNGIYEFPLKIRCISSWIKK